MPNLIWMPTTSPNAEASHAKFWEKKLVLPVDDPFWENHHPGDRWNCKCSLKQTDESVNNEAIDGNLPKPQRGLDNNPGIDGHIFNDTHPYFPESCSNCPFGTRSLKNKLKYVFFNANKCDCFECPKINNSIPSQANLNPISDLFDSIKSNHGYASKKSEIISRIQPEVVSFLNSRNITLKDDKLCMVDVYLLHAIRDKKVELGKAVEEDDLKRLPMLINTCNIYWDDRHCNLVYVTQQHGGIQKFIFNTNYTTQVRGKNKKKITITTNTFVTAGKLHKEDLNGYYKIK